MIKSEELFVLVKSLTRSEKRYFRLFARQHSTVANYIRLFDAIDSQEVYDESIIKNQFKGEKFIKQLHVTKSYLRNLILKSLRNFHAGISKSAKQNDILRNVEILFNKELYKHAISELKRAESIAWKYEISTGIFEVYEWKRKLSQAMRPYDYKSFIEMLSTQSKGISQLSNKLYYQNMIVKVSEAVINDMVNPVEHEELLEDDENALTLEAKVLHYNAIYFRKIQQGESNKATEALISLLDLMEKHPDRIMEEPGMYISTVNNLISFYVFNKEYDNAIIQIKRAHKMYALWKLAGENRTLLKQVLRTYNIELEVYRDTGTHKNNPGVLSHIRDFVDANKHKMPHEYLMSFRYQLAHVYFTLKDFSEAIKWTNDLLNDRKKGTRSDLQVYARLLNLMIHTEQRNLFVLRYFVGSTKRFLTKSGEIKPYQKVLLNFFTDIGKVPVYEYKNRFRKLDRDLFPEDDEPLVPQDDLDYIDFSQWIKEHI